MTNLQHGDYLALLGLIAEVSAARCLDDFRRRAVAALRRLVPCDVVSHVEMRPGKRAVSLVEPADVYFPEGEEILARHGTDNPVISHFHRAPDDQILKISDLIDRRELHRLELYQHLYRRVGTEHQIAFALPASSPSIVAIALSRTSRDFDERDRHLLELARPHLVQARANAALLDQMQAAMAHGGQAVIALGQAGRVQFATPHAERLLDHYFGGGTRESELPEGIREWASRERNRLAVDGEVPARAAELVAEGDGWRLLARFLPGDRESGEDLVLLTETRDVGAADIASLGLSPREAEVLRLVARGITDAQIAKALVVSPRTVHKHLEHVYEKLGVRTRTAAVNRAFGELTARADRTRRPAA